MSQSECEWMSLPSLPLILQFSALENQYAASRKELWKSQIHYGHENIHKAIYCSRGSLKVD